MCSIMWVLLQNINSSWGIRHIIELELLKRIWAQRRRVLPGADGIARVADIVTKKGTIRRAFNNICPLPVSQYFDLTAVKYFNTLAVWIAQSTYDYFVTVLLFRIYSFKKYSPFLLKAFTWFHPTEREL